MTNISDVGIRFENVPDVYVIYISKSDFLHTGLTICHVDSVIRENRNAGRSLDESIDNAIDACTRRHMLEEFF